MKAARFFLLRGVLSAVLCGMLLLSLVRLSPAEEPYAVGGPAEGGETLLFEEIPSVFGASKYEQKVTEAPSSVTIITAEEIRKYGYRTLADILKSVRSFYITYDRNYQYIGVRGFNRPGDFNTRILLLVDGHRMNNNVYDQAFIGTDFLVDVDLIDRVEVIRGPSSSLYGSNAFFGVVNVMTKRGRDFGSAEISGAAGTSGTYQARLTYGNRFEEGPEILVSGSLYESEGDNRIYYREYDAPETNNGIAKNMDDDAFQSVFTKVSYGGLTLHGGAVTRRKTVPTGAYGVVFNDSTNETRDTQGYIDLQYEHAFPGKFDLMARAYYDVYTFIGDYLYDYADPGDPPFIVPNRDFTRGERIGAELKGTKRLGPHMITLGGEYQWNLNQDQRNYDRNPYEEYLDSDEDSRNWALYGQDEFSIFEPLVLNVGLRYDNYQTFGGNFSPRAALIYNPLPKTTFKLLYGEAFRAPNAFEMFYDDGGITSKGNPDLEQEKIKTYELVWEQYLPRGMLLTVSGFYYEVEDLITQVKAVDGLLTYENSDTVKAKGVEFELDGKVGSIEGRISYSFQETEDEAGDILSNSPRHLAKLNLIAPVLPEKIFAGVDVQYTGKRKTLSGNTTSDVLLANLTIFTRKLVRGLEASASVYNVFDKKYGDPGSEEHIQDTIEQDGRTFRVKLTYRF